METLDFEWQIACTMVVNMSWKTSLRFLARHRTLSAIAILTTALAVGANAVIFGVVRAVFLRPLGFPDEARLVEIKECNQSWHQKNLKQGHSPGNARGCISVSGALYRDFQSQATSYEKLGAANYSTEMVALTGSAEPMLVTGLRVTPDLFRVLAVPPLLGRWLDSDAPAAYSNREVVLGYELWKGRFGGSPSVVGTEIVVAGVPHRIVGVMPADFHFPEQVQLWRTHSYGTPDYEAAYRARNLQVVGRLKPGVDRRAAQAEATALSARAATGGWTSEVETLLGQMTFSYRRGFVILGIAVVIVLLIACANLSNLLMATLEGRSAEMALRMALGATRKDLYGQIVRESLALSISGGLLGLLFVVWGLDLIRPLIPAGIPRSSEIRADWPVALFSLAVSAGTGLLFSVLPGLRACEDRLGGTLRPGIGRTTMAATGLRGGLVSVQVALAIVLLSGAGLLFSTLRRLAEQQLGFRADHLLVAQLPLPARGHAGSNTQRAAFAADFVARVAEQPGVRGAGLGYPLPFTGGQQGRTGVAIEGRPGIELGIVQYRSFTPGLFAALGVPLLEGRLFQDADQPGAPMVCVVNRSLARKAFPTGSAVGRRLNIGNGWVEIVGVVGDVRQLALDKEPGPEMYVPWYQNPNFANVSVAVRYAGTDDAAAAALREAVRKVNPNQPVGKMATMDELITQSTATRRFPLVLFSIFSALALGIAAVGIYGVVSHSVSTRTQEMGVRMALGADSGTLLRMVLWQALIPVAAGVAAGLGLALIATRYLGSLLFEVRPNDPLTLAATSAVLVLVAAAASLGPALRACRTDPVEALRCN